MIGEAESFQSAHHRRADGVAKFGWRRGRRIRYAHEYTSSANTLHGYVGCSPPNRCIAFARRWDSSLRICRPDDGRDGLPSAEPASKQI